MFVQFADSTQTAIISSFGSMQDSEIYPNQGEVEAEDPRYIAFIEATNPKLSIVDINTQRRNELLDAANRVIPALQDAVDLDDSSANPGLLKEWKEFRIAVNKLELTQPTPAWPVAPQSGYGAVSSQPVQSA